MSDNTSKMTTIRARILEVFRNLKSDAIPKPPRKDKGKCSASDITNEENIENVDTSNTSDDTHETYEEEIPNVSDYTQSRAKNKKGKTDKDTSQKDKRTVNSVNTQATGSVFNFVDCKDLHYGNVFINNFGSSNGQKSPSPSASEEITIKKTNDIILLMESTVEPEHEYIDYIAKNMGRNWRDLFIALGYNKGRIETVEYDQAKNGVSEARYKLLLDWVRNADDATVGRLATELWEQGEREVVQGLALIYKKNKQARN